jgi:dimethylglycine dehydrogenase
MEDRYQVVVIGGGIVGVSVAYHLALRGLTDVAIVERAELTAGSSWHAAGGFHAINADMRIAALQKYTIGLYDQIERESGRSVGMHMSGGIELAGTPERWRLLKSELAWHHMMGTDARLLTPEEAVELVPIVDPTGLEGALFDPHEGNLDPNGATYAYADAAKARGVDVVLHTRVLTITPPANAGAAWRLDTEQGPLEAEHVVNAGGLWARRVGRMVGVDHPLTPMLHHYLVTEDVPEVVAIGGDMPAVTDLEGFTYLQKEGGGVLLGVYERTPRHWKPEGADWDFGMELFPEELERIMPELSIGFARFPVLQDVGIKRWVNGAFTFTPDGNPLVGPVAGLPGYWAACGVMAGFSQCAAIGLALANWIVDGDPGDDVFGMDVARFGTYASNDRYLRETTGQFYARRFVLAYPNEQLPAGRPLKTTPCYDAFREAGAVFGENWGLEVPLVFAEPGFEETPTLGRSNAFPLVAEEVEAVRAAVGAYEIAGYARYEVTGPGAEAWLDRLVASRLPEVGRLRLAPMLNETGRLMGDLSVTRLAEDRFWLTGSYYLQDWHLRWFRRHLPPAGVELRNVTDRWMGFAISGPASRELLGRLTADDVSNDGFPFLAVRPIDVGSAEAIVGRLSLTGELGFEIVVPATMHRTLWRELAEAGSDLGLRPIGDYAVDSLRLEKGYGIWNAEFTQAYTPAMSGLDRFVAYDKEGFVGRDAALRERDEGPSQRLALLEVDADDAEAAADESLWLGDRLAGFVTSGAYGHHVGMSLALAYVDVDLIEAAAPLTAYVVGDPRPARILPEPPYDPAGTRIREAVPA